MNYRIEYLRPAVIEMGNIADWYGSTIALHVSNKIDNLALFPGMGRRIAAEEEKLLHVGGYYKLVCDDFVIIYRHLGEVIYIYHIAHIKTDYKSLF